MMRKTKSSYLKTALIAAAIAIVLALAGCIGTSGDTSSSASSSSAASVSTSSASTTSASSASASSSESSQQSSSSSSSSNQSASSSSSAQQTSSASSSSQQSSGSSSQQSSSSSAAYVSPDPDSYAEQNLAPSSGVGDDIKVKKNGTYTDKEHVALYIHLYGTVPSNYITKTKARKAGWVQEEGNLDEVLPGKSIGGGGFYNDDHMMPDAPGREWFECDIDYTGGFRNAKRIVYSNDGLIYYTGDHYKTFERLY